MWTQCLYSSEGPVCRQCALSRGVIASFFGTHGYVGVSVYTLLSGPCHFRWVCLLKWADPNNTASCIQKCEWKQPTRFRFREVGPYDDKQPLRSFWIYLIDCRYGLYSPKGSCTTECLFLVFSYCEETHVACPFIQTGSRRRHATLITRQVRENFGAKRQTIFSFD